MEFFKRAYYLATAHLPRRLPSTMEDYMRIKHVFLEYYKVPDSPISWATVAGQVSSTPAHKIRKPWAHMANAAKRMSINNLSQQIRARAHDELQVLMDQATQKLQDEVQKNAQEATPGEPETNAVPQSQASEGHPEEQSGH